MRDRRDDCTDSPRNPTDPQPPNAFDRQFLNLFARRDPAPALPEADNAGPWRVTRLHGAGDPRWGCLGCGEPAPRLQLQEPDVAHMVAAGLSAAERPPRFRFQADVSGQLHLLHHGQSVGTARHGSDSLPLLLSALDHLRADPLALAHLLMAVPDGVLERAGAIVMEMANRDYR